MYVGCAYGDPEGRARLCEKELPILSVRDFHNENGGPTDYRQRAALEKCSAYESIRLQQKLIENRSEGSGNKLLGGRSTFLLQVK